MKIRLCKVGSCNRIHYGLGYCIMHHARFKRRTTTEDLRRGNGKGTINRDGYLLIWVDGVRVLEHRWLAERALGRKLKRREVVHHMNGDKLDNRTPFNLVVCPNDLYHQLLHKRAEMHG